MINSAKGRRELIAHYQSRSATILSIDRFRKKKQVKIIFYNGKIETLIGNSDYAVDQFYRMFRHHVLNIYI